MSYTFLNGKDDRERGRPKEREEKAIGVLNLKFFADNLALSSWHMNQMIPLASHQNTHTGACVNYMMTDSARSLQSVDLKRKETRGDPVQPLVARRYLRGKHLRLRVIPFNSYSYLM